MRRLRIKTREELDGRGVSFSYWSNLGKINITASRQIIQRVDARISKSDLELVSQKRNKSARQSTPIQNRQLQHSGILMSKKCREERNTSTPVCYRVLPSRKSEPESFLDGQKLALVQQLSQERSRLDKKVRKLALPQRLSYRHA